MTGLRLYFAQIFEAHFFLLIPIDVLKHAITGSVRQ